MLVPVQYFKSSSLIFLNVKGTSFNDTFVICRWQLIKSIKTCCHLSQDETTMNLHTFLTDHVYPANTHISRCAESTAEFDRFVFHPLYKLYRVTSIPHICSAHGKAHQRPSFFSSAWKHIDTPASLCRYISVHVPEENESFNNHYTTEAFMCWE